VWLTMQEQHRNALVLVVVAGDSGCVAHLGSGVPSNPTLEIISLEQVLR